MLQPLSLTGVGTRSLVREIRCRHETRHFLESLGFTVGTQVSVVCESSGNLIVAVKDARVAMSRALAHTIVVEPDPSVESLCASCPAATGSAECEGGRS